MASRKFAIAVEINAKDNASTVSSRVFRTIASEARAAASGFKSTFSQIVNLKSAILGLGVAAAGSKVITEGVEWAKSADETSKFARQVGLSTEALTELEYAGGRIGTSQEVFRKSVQFLNKGLGELPAGGGKLKELAKAYPEMMRAMTRGGTENALQVALRAIERLPDAQSRAALATRLFGKSGAEMIRMAAAGAGEVSKLRKEAEAYGRLTTKGGLDAEEFVDSLEASQMAVAGLKNALGAGLLPVLTPAINRFAEWVKQNRDLIRLKMQDAIEAAGRAMAWIVDRGLPGLSRGLEAVSRHWALIRSGAEAFAAIWVGGRLAAGVGAVATSFAAIATSLQAATALASGGAVATAATAAAATSGASMASAFGAAMAGPIGLAAGAALATGFLLYQNAKRDQEIKVGNNRAKAMADAFEANRWRVALPQIADDSERAVFSQTKGETLESFRQSPYWQKQVGDEIQRRAGAQLGITTIEEAEARRQQFTSPFAVTMQQAGTAPNVDGAVGVEIDFKNLPRGVTTRIRSSGRVTARGTVRRGVALDSYDEDVE